MNNILFKENLREWIYGILLVSFLLFSAWFIGQIPILILAVIILSGCISFGAKRLGNEKVSERNKADIIRCCFYITLISTICFFSKIDVIHASVSNVIFKGGNHQKTSYKESLKTIVDYTMSLMVMGIAILNYRHMNALPKRKTLFND